MCYLLVTPPGASSDEGAHLVRAVGVVHGDVTGGAARFEPLLPPPRAGDPRSIAWLRATSRSESVPPWLDDAPMFPCFVPQPQRLAASCRTPVDPRATRTAGRIDTWVGSYPPFAYALLGVPSVLARTPVSALYAGRAAVLVGWLFLLWLAVRLLPRAGLPWLGLGVSATVVSYAAQLNPSGLEIGAAFAVWAGLFALRRGRTDREVVTALAVGGVVLILSRELGLLWFALAFVVAAPPRSSFFALHHARRLVPLAVALTLAALAAIGWSVLRQPHPRTHRVLLPGPGTVERMFREYAASFGFSDVTPPVIAFLPWAAVVVGVCSLLLLRRATRWVVLRWGLAVYLATWVTALATAANGFLTGGRYVAPVIAGLFVFSAGELPRGRGPVNSGRPRPVAILAAGAALVALQVFSVLTVAARYGRGGTGASWPNTDWPWSPPGGYPLTLALALAGLTLLTAQVVSVRRPTLDDRGTAMPVGTAASSGE